MDDLGHVRAYDGLRQDALEGGIVHVAIKHCRSPIGAVEGVIDQAALSRSWWS